MPLTADDVRNLIVLMNRSAFQNLNEAKAAVVLENKLKELHQTLTAPPVVTEESPSA